jgi:uncharacterized protein
MGRVWILVMVAAGLGLKGCRVDAPETPEQAAARQSAEQTDAVIAKLRAAYAAFNRGDIAAAVEPMDERIEWSEPKQFPGGGVYHGRDGVRRYLAGSRAGMADGTSEPEEFIPVRDKIVVLVHARVRPKGSFDWQELRLADVYTVREGKVVAMRAFADQGEGLAWARGDGEAR